jgi:hypothetical protein
MSGGRIRGGVFFVLVAGLVVLSGCGGAGDSGNAHINQKSGSTNGAVPDERVGTKPQLAKKKVVALSAAAEAAHCYLLRRVPSKNDKVISMSAPAPKYEKEPPMVGPHVAPPNQQADGAYLVLPDERTTVASLDHGRMLIQYAPDLTEKIQLELKGLYDSMYGGVLLFPNNVMNYAVAATTWSNGLFCSGYKGTVTLEAIRAFGKATWGKYGDEPVDKFPVEGPTPAKPEESGKAGSDSAP